MDEFDNCLALFVLLGGLESVLVFPAEHGVATRISIKECLLEKVRAPTFYRKHLPHDGVQSGGHVLRPGQQPHSRPRRKDTPGLAILY